MRQACVRIICLLILSGWLLAACSAGHLGGNEIAFVRGGHLWTIDSDGANAFQVEGDSTAVVGYALSPSHEIFFYRTLDPQFAATQAGKQVRTDPVTGLASDVPSTLNTIGIDGGSALPIQFSNPGIVYSDAWWNTSGTRLLYREYYSGTVGTPGTVQWWVAQNDQPGGIGRKALPDSLSIPSLASDSSLAIGNTKQGVFSTKLDGSDMRYLITPEPPGNPLPAALERFLWQPAQAHPAILYAVATQRKSPALTVQLMLRESNGQTRTLTTCQCNQFAWSPDGNSVLYSEGASFTVLHIAHDSSFTLTAEADSVPYWSPDSRFLLLDGQHTLQFINAQTGQQQAVLSDGSTPGIAGVIETGVNALLQPIANSLWSPDSRHFVFVTRGRLLWQGNRLSHAGLYTAAIDDQGRVQGSPTVIDTGNDSQPGWSYEDANTSFLY